MGPVHMRAFPLPFGLASVKGQVGDALETWEPLLLVAPTEPYEEWRQQEE